MCTDTDGYMLKYLQRDDLENLAAARTAELERTNEQLQREIIQRIQTEVQLQQMLEKANELNELKTRFHSMVSHEFRAPLAIIQSSSDLLKLYSADSSNKAITRHIEQIQQQVRHMVVLLDEVLSIGRAEMIRLDFRPQVTDVAQFCHELVTQYQKSAPTHRLVFSAENSNLLACLDKKLLQHALTNLLSNAVKYSPEGSTIQIVVCPSGEDILIRVQDQGIGIPETDLKYLFELYHRATNVGRIHGTGVGLAIVKQAIDAHGGTITVESTVNAGSTFTIALPAAPSDVITQLETYEAEYRAG